MMSRNVVPQGVVEFRKRLKQLGKPQNAIGKRLKKFVSWIGSPVAWLALFVSVGTAYYSIFYYVDEVRLSIDELPMVYFDKDSNAFMVTGPKSLIFINTGTRAILIQKVELDFNQPGENEKRRVPCEVGGIWRGLDLQFTPTVVKPGEINAVPVTYKSRSNLVYLPNIKFEELKQRNEKIDDAFDVQGLNGNPSTDLMTLDSCFRFVIVTPSGATDQARIRIADYSIKKSSPPQNSALAHWQFNSDIPVGLYRSSSFRPK